MKKLFLFKILMVSVSILILNSCSKANDKPSPGSNQNSGSTDSTSTDSTRSTHSFNLTYVISPLSSDIGYITFNNEKGIPETVYNMDLFPGGIRELRVSANSFRARIEVAVGNSTSHPVGFRLQVRVNGETRLTRDFMLPPWISNFSAIAVYDVQTD